LLVDEFWTLIHWIHYWIDWEMAKG